MTEAAFKDRVMRLLRAVPESYWFRPGAGMFGKAGISDILGVVDGWAVAIECKAPGAYKDPKDGLTPPQRNFLEQWKASGGYTAVIDSIDGAMKVAKDLSTPM